MIARRVLACVGIAVASSCATVAIYVAWAVVHDARRRDAANASFGELVELGTRGEVEEIRYHDRVYTFRTKHGTRRAVGPRADATQIALIKPTDPSAAPPRVVVE